MLISGAKSSKYRHLLFWQVIDSQRAKLEKMLSESEECLSKEEKEKFTSTHQMMVESTICDIDLEGEWQKQELQSKVGLVLSGFCHSILDSLSLKKGSSDIRHEDSVNL